MRTETTLQNTVYYLTSASIIALILICTAWELAVAPLRPGGSWLVLKVLPLLFALPGILKGKKYTYQWASMLAMAYLAEGTVRVMTETGKSSTLAILEIILSLILFFGSLFMVKATSDKT